MQPLFIMSADLSLVGWAVRTSLELAEQEVWPKVCGWKLHPSRLPAFTSPTATGDHEIVVSITHRGHNRLWNYRKEEKCANKHMQETNRKSTLRRGINSPLLLLQVFFLWLDSRILKVFSTLNDSMILWAKEVWMFTTRWCKSIEGPNLPARHFEHL